MNIHFPTGGGAEVDGKKLGDKQLGALVQELVRQGLLPRYVASIVERVKNETEQKVTEAVCKDAKAEAREELRSELDERFQALLDK